MILVILSQRELSLGAEYTLCISLSLLMSAVVSFLSESVVESLRGAYKLRKSYQLLHKLYDMIVAVDGINGTTKIVSSMNDITEDSDDDFVDATDDMKDLATPVQLTQSVQAMTLTDGETQSEQISLHSSSSTPISSPPRRSSTIDRRASITTVSTFHDIPSPPSDTMTITDQTIYPGTLMALGSIMLLISLLPPSLSRLLSIIGFRGSRSQALSMLWKVSSQPGPFGSLGTFVLGSYYGNIVQNSDIVSDEYSANGGNGGATLEKLHAAIIAVRNRYPSSALWAVEEARMESIKGNLEEVVQRLSTLKVKSQMPQIESLVVFEGALYFMPQSKLIYRHYLMTHQYENAATWFIHMCETNNWSHGLYTYIAGICYAELSRHNPNQHDYAHKASTLLERVPSLLQKRKSFGGKRIPFEQFVERKINRFKSRAGTKPIVEGVTGPVTEELTYLLCNGQKRMKENELEKSWQSLELWSSFGCEEEEVFAMELMKSVVDRNAGRLEAAWERIELKVISEGLNKKVPLGINDWIAGFAYYEVFFFGGLTNVDGCYCMDAKTTD